MAVLYSIYALFNRRECREYIDNSVGLSMTEAKEFIEMNFKNKELSVAMLAEKAGMSDVYFRKLFTQIYGTSPMAYVHNLRIKKAKEMLSSDYGSITDVAYSLGYASVYDFSRDFKKHTGVPPSGY